jgi:hypothetical protein
MPATVATTRPGERTDPELDEEGEQADQDEARPASGHASHRPEEAQTVLGAHEDQFRSERHRYER